jgi:hypothetical protein
MGSNVKLTFNGFSGYYGYVSNGYQGFDFIDMYFLTKLGIDTYYPNEKTGYNNDLHGSGVAFTLGASNYDGYGWTGCLISPDKETFTLKSGDFAAAWDDSMNFSFTSYHDDTMKARVEINLKITGTLIDFANYGNDFKNITKVGMYAIGKGHVSSVYGSGYQIVIDNLKAVWQGAVPDAHGARHHAQVAHGILGPLHDHATGLSGSGAYGAPLSAAHGSFHSVITSLDAAAD